MPVIRYQPRTSQPDKSGGLVIPLGLAQSGQRLDPSDFGLAQRGAIRAADSLAQTMGALAQAGDQLQDLGRQVDNWDQTARYFRATGQARTSLAEFEAGLEARGDYQNFEADLAAKAGKLKEQLAQGLHGQFAQRFELDFDGDVLQAQTKARAASRTKAMDAALAAEAQARQADMNLIGRPGTPSDQRDRLQRGYIERVQGLHGQGLINAGQAVQLIQAVDGFRAEVELKELIDADPERAPELLKAPEGKAAELLADVPANRLDDLGRHAELARKQALAQRQKDAEDRAYGAIKARIGDDLDGQMAALSDPGAIQALGLDLRQAQFLKGVFRAEAAQRQDQADRQRQGQRLAVAEQMRQMVTAGDRKGAVELIGRSAVFEPHERERMVEALGKAQWATDPAVEAEVIIKLHRGEFKSAADLLPYLGHGLGGDDVNRYGSLAEQMAAKKKAGGIDFFELAVKEFDDQGTGQKWKAKKNDFVVSLDYLMRQAKLEPGDPKVHELSKRLLAEVDGSGWWDKRAFELVSELKPWEDPSRLKQGQFGLDTDIPEASADELKAVERLLGRQAESAPKLYAASAENKRLALRAVRQGDDILGTIASDLRLWGVEKLGGKHDVKTIWDAASEVRGRGLPVTPANIEHVLTKMGEAGL